MNYKHGYNVYLACSVKIEDKKMVVYRIERVVFRLY